VSGKLLDDIFQVSSLPGLAHTIQLALAPAFLLNGIGIILGMLTGRLTRIVDRARVVEKDFTPRDHPDHDHQVKRPQGAETGQQASDKPHSEPLPDP